MAIASLLLCLINQLKEDDTFNICINYVFGLSKMLSVLAIYNDMGLFPSIGEITVDDGLVWTGEFEGDDAKPGMHVSFPNATSTPPDFTPSYAKSVEGWASYRDRNATITPAITTYDEWDKVVLRNSKSTIKKLFKTYYNSRGSRVIERNLDFAPGKILKNRLRAAFQRPPGGRIPWFWKRRLRPNPFNANGIMCEEKD